MTTLLHRILSLVALYFVVAPLLLFATVSDGDLQKEYGDRVLTLRQVYPGAHLRFDSSGKLIGKAAPGSWTTDGMLRVEKMSFADGALDVPGQRLFLIYDSGTKQMRDVRALKKVAWIQNHSKIDIEIGADNAQPDIAGIAKLMNLIFLSPEEKLVDAVPGYWKDWLQHGQGYKPPSPDVANAKSVETDAANMTPKVGGKISAPRAVHTPDPQYSEPARQSLYQGTCILWLIVGADGVVRDIRISRALGLGLDDEAVKAVQTWKFEPALENGQPVRVQINVEVNFRLN